jgi:GT2 family glycosyltransferase
VPDVTIVVVPRERFQLTRRSLESIYDTTTSPFALIYVDGGSPAATRRYLESQARARGFRLVRTEQYLTPNQARNLGMSEAATRYIVFVDNDVLVTPGWLEALIRCAEETGAWVVGPLYCHGELERGEVHMTGGHAHIFDGAGVRRFREDHRFFGRPLREVRPRLRREPCEMVESTVCWCARASSDGWDRSTRG